MKQTIVFALLLMGCASNHQPNIEGVRLLKVEQNGISQPAADSLIGPYKQALQGAMSEAIIYNPKLLQKQQPESALGNLLADMVLEAGRANFGTVDMAMLNYGGIRSALPADTLRIGHVLEMLPFNNMLQLVEMDSALLTTFVSHWLEKGGTPLAGVRILASGKQLKEVRVGGELLSSRKTYRVVMPDYVANGGDGCAFLSGALSQQTGTQLISDLVIEALKSYALQQPQLNARIDGRFIIE